MAGLLNPAAQPQAAAMPADQGSAQGVPSQGGADTLNDPILKQIEQGIEEKIPPEMKDAYLSIVVSGMQVMFSKETSKLLEQSLSMSGDTVSNIATGISKLMILIYNEAAKTEKTDPATGKKTGGMDVRMAVPGALTLMCQALDYWESTKGGEVTPELAAACTKQTTMMTLKAFGITEDQVGKTIAAGQQGGAAPADADPGAAPPQPMTGA